MGLFGDDSEETDQGGVDTGSTDTGSQDYFDRFQTDVFGPAFTGDTSSADNGASSTDNVGATETPEDQASKEQDANFSKVLENTADQTLSSATSDVAQKAEEPLKKTQEELGTANDPLAIKPDYKDTLQDVAKKEIQDEKLRSIAGGQGQAGGGPGGGGGSGGVGGALGGALKGIASILKAANNPKQNQTVQRTFTPLQQPNVGTPSYYGSLLDYLNKVGKR